MAKVTPERRELVPQPANLPGISGFFRPCYPFPLPIRFMSTTGSASEARDENGHLIRELHGVTLANIVEYLHAHYGWPGLDERLRMNCFAVNPSVKSALAFLRRTPWARTKVEALYIDTRTAEVRQKDKQ